MIYPNGRYIKRSPGRFFGPGAGLELRLIAGDRKNPFVGTCAKVASIPSGYGLRTNRAPIVNGGMSGGSPIALIGIAQGVEGLLMQGDAPFSIDAFGFASLFAFMQANGDISIQTQGAINAVVSLQGDGTFQIDAQGFPSAFVFLQGQSGVQLTASAVLQYTQTLVGNAALVDQTGLTSQAVTDAVWGAIATSNNTPGTMGAKLNAAGSSGDPWASVLESGLTAADILRVVLSAVAGKREGIGTATETYYGQDGTTIRIEFAHDANNNGTPFIDGTV